MKMNYIHRSTFLVLIFMMLSARVLLAQSGPSGADDGDGTVPIDGGISLLLAAGALYGGKKLQQRTKNNFTIREKRAH